MCESFEEFVRAAIPASSEIFAPKLLVSLVVSKGSVLLSLKLSMSSISSPRTGQVIMICKHIALCNMLQ